jgi:MFS family permease
LNVAAVYLGLSVGPLIGGLITHYLGWRSIFLVNAVLCVLVVIAVQWKLKGEWAEAKGEQFDITGCVIYGIGLALLIYGFSLLPGTLGFILVSIGLVILCGFIFWESRQKSPVLDISLFHQSLTFSMSNLAALINYMATSAITFLLSLYLQYIKGFTADVAGLIVIAQPVVMTIVSPLAGRMSDKIEPRIVASIGMGLTFTGLVMLSFLSQDISLIYIIVSLAVLGFGFGLFSSPNTNAIMSAVEKKYYGVASATVGTMRTVGQTMSMGISLLIFNLFMGNQQITPSLYPQFITSANVIFILCSALCFLGIFASLARGKMHS